MSEFNELSNIENLIPPSEATGPGAFDFSESRLRVRSPELERAHDKHRCSNSGPPSSPTDNLLSPCTRKLIGKKQISGKSAGNRPTSGGRTILGGKRSLSKTMKQFSLEAQLEGRSYRCPCRRLPLILGSSSSNRAEVLRKVDWKYTIVAPDIDEKAIRCADPHELPLMIAKAKADAVIKKIQDSNSSEEHLADILPFVLLTCDQIVLFDDEVREKPTSAEEALRFLTSYSNRSVETISAVVATHYPSMVQDSGIDVAKVNWKSIDDVVAERVIARGEIFTSAGGFRIEDEDLRPLIKSIDGSVDSVMGMPLDLASSLLMNVVSTVSLSSRSEESL